MMFVDLALMSITTDKAFVCKNAVSVSRNRVITMKEAVSVCVDAISHLFHNCLCFYNIYILI